MYFLISYSKACSEGSVPKHFLQKCSTEPISLTFADSSSSHYLRTQSQGYLTSDSQFSQALPLQNSLTREGTGTLLNWFIANKQIKLLLHKIWYLFSSISCLHPTTFVECRPTIEKLIHKSLLVKVLWSFTSLEFVSPGSRTNCFQVLKADGNLHCRIQLWALSSSAAAPKMI